MKNKKDRGNCKVVGKETNDGIVFNDAIHNHEPKKKKSESKSVKVAKKQVQQVQQEQQVPLRRSQRSKQQQKYYGDPSNDEPTLVRNETGEHIEKIQDLSRLQHAPETDPSQPPTDSMIVQPRSPVSVIEQEGQKSNSM